MDNLSHYVTAERTAERIIGSRVERTVNRTTELIAEKIGSILPGVCIKPCSRRAHQQHIPPHDNLHSSNLQWTP